MKVDTYIPQYLLIDYHVAKTHVLETEWLAHVCRLVFRDVRMLPLVLLQLLLG